jgi:hypothetical protein
MPDRSYDLHGVRVFECPAEGARLGNDRDAVELVGTASPHRAALIAIPIERLGDDFFRLRTRIAGEIIQKFVTYGLRLAIVGDISRHVGESSALRDFVNESNRGDHVWFVASLEELGKRLERAQSPGRLTRLIRSLCAFFSLMEKEKTRTLFAQTSERMRHPNSP